MQQTHALIVGTLGKPSPRGGERKHSIASVPLEIFGGLEHLFFHVGALGKPSPRGGERKHSVWCFRLTICGWLAHLFFRLSTCWHYGMKFDVGSEIKWNRKYDLKCHKRK